MPFNKLTSQEEDVILGKGTEKPFSGEYDNFYEDGVFICKRCNAPLFSSEAKFDAGCGWPAFDEEYPNSLKRLPDHDGEKDPVDPSSRTEIQCANCGAHLGHEFLGEHLTEKDTRHCVNSLSIRFIPRSGTVPRFIPKNQPLPTIIS